MAPSGADIDQLVLAVQNELVDLLSLRKCRTERSFASGPARS
jgi:hypothetical protein